MSAPEPEEDCPPKFAVGRRDRGDINAVAAVSPLVEAVRRFWRNAARSRAILPVLAGVCLGCTGSALLTTAVSLHLGQPGMDPGIVQIVLTAYPVGFLIGCLATRRIVVRFGHEGTFGLILALAFAATLGFAFTAFLPLWFCFRLFGGMAMAGMFVVCESWINLYAEERNRGAMFALYMLSTAIAVLLGQVLVGLIGAHSPHLFPVAAAFVAAAFAPRLLGKRWPALPAAAIQRDQAMPGALPEERLGAWQLFKIAPVTVVSIFQGGITNMNVFVLTPIYGMQIGLSAATTVGLVTTLSIAGMLAQTPVGWLSDRFDRRVILLVQGLLSVTLCILIAALGNASEPLLFTLFFLYGAAALTIYPVAIAFANSRLPSRHMVAASGTLLLLYSVGNVATPGLAAGLMTHTIPQAMFFLLGAGALLVAVTACYNLLRRESFALPALGVPPDAGEPAP
jgi:MFS family permease